MPAIARPQYLNRLIRKMNNGMIKVITEVRRFGKSYLLFELFYRYLQAQGIAEDAIVRLVWMMPAARSISTRIGCIAS